MSGTNPFRRNIPETEQSSYLPTAIASSRNASERDDEREHGDRSEPRIPPIDTGKNKLQGLKKKKEKEKKKDQTFMHLFESSSC